MYRNEKYAQNSTRKRNDTEANEIIAAVKICFGT